MRSVVECLRRIRAQPFCLVVFATLAVVTSACGGSSASRSPAAPDNGIDATALAGSWSGTLVTLQATGTLRLQLLGPQAERYTGTWSAAFADASLNRQGTLSAGVTWTTVGGPRLPVLDVNLTPVPRPACDPLLGERMYVLSLGLTAPNRMVGEGEFGGCGGQLNLVRVQLSR